ncbi:MAG: hypothetical protein K0B01_06555 [Syntrophobacterales bacterium]|nr:hypothetical protein [Syntrophobacterales bacterium]
MPFDFGRPLGAPDEPEFQKKVLLAALSLLEKSGRPIIEDFLEDAPVSENEFTPTACPVSFRAQTGQGEEIDDIGKLLADFREEAEGLQNWFDIGLKKRGRTTTGTSNLSLKEIVELFSVFIKGDMPESPVSSMPVDITMKLASEDLKAYYTEALSAQPGGPTSPDALANWFWGETAASRVLGKMRDRALLCEDKGLKILGSLLLIPRNQLHRFTN